MRPALFLTALVLFSCSRSQPQAANDTPSALEDHNGVEKVAAELGSSYSRSGYHDLVEELFQDVLAKDTALNSLMVDLAEQDEQHADSMENYNRFLGLNRSYYEAATKHIQQLSDSAERAGQEHVIDRSRNAHELRIKACEASAGTYGLARSRGLEIVELIKLKRTLPLIEAYQKKEPSYQALWNAEVMRMKALEKRLLEQVR